LLRCTGSEEGGEEVSETTVTIMVALIGALGTAITALVGWLMKKGLNYLDAKTKFLDEAGQLKKKEAIKGRIVEVTELAVRSTMQTYVDELKERNADGKLTKDEAKEAFKKSYEAALGVLKSEGIDVGRELLSATIEAIVGSIKGAGKNSSGGEATPQAA